jgi:hypothetical protein
MTIDVFSILRAIMYKPPGQDRIGRRIKTMVAIKIITMALLQPLLPFFSGIPTSRSEKDGIAEDSLFPRSLT